VSSTPPPISGVYSLFAPEIAEHMVEAFERMGMDPADIGARHITSFKRSLSYMLNSEWNTLGLRQWMITRAQQTVTVNVPAYTLPLGSIDVFDAVLIRNGNATPINRMSRSEYLEIPNKTMTGRPDRYFVDRQYNQCVWTFWRTPENSSDIIGYYYFQQMARPGVIANQLQMPPHALEAFVAGMAAHLAMKFSKDAFEMLYEYYCGGSIVPGMVGGVLAAALEEDRERADVALTVMLNPRGGRR
jgi:hypothetical protein